MRSVGYIRVSTSGQDTAAQRAAIEAAAAVRGEFIAEWFDEVRGGHSLRRPELKRLREAVAKRQVGRVYVFRLDRLARSGVADTFRVLDEFRAHGCDLVTVADGLPSVVGPWGDVVIAVLAAAAEIELGALRERLRVARERLEREGGKWGRPARLDRKDWPLLLELQARGYSTRKIAMAVKVPRTTVMRALVAARAEAAQ
jgi:DNA invertase Pin-like site-specific DNA recombinase